MMKNSTNASAPPLRIRALQKARQRQSVSRENKQNKVKHGLKKKSMGSMSLREEVMSKEIYEAALTGYVKIFEGTVSDEYLLRKTFVLNSIVHLALRSSKSGDSLNGFKRDTKFVLEAVSRFPHLLRERNLDGDTPLHLAAESLGNEEFVMKVCENIPTDVVSPLLRMKNSMGNTPLHVALIRNQLKVALIMLEKDPSLATILNNALEAPLHLAFKYFPHLVTTDDIYNIGLVKQRSSMEQKKLRFIEMIREKERSQDYEIEEYEIEKYDGSDEEHEEIEIIMELLEKASYVAGWQDASSMTPLHLAASLHKAVNIVVISYIIHCCPQSMEVRDSSGKTILHHLIHRILYLSEAQDCLSELNPLINHQDHDGNTPLHLVLINKDFIMFQLILSNPNWVPDFRLRNKAGQAVISLTEQGEWATPLKLLVTMYCVILSTTT